MIKYKIKEFDESWGQIVVEYEGGYSVAIDLPIDDNQLLPVGAELEDYIISAAPADLIARANNIKNGVTNAQDIFSLCIKYQKLETPDTTLSNAVRKDRDHRLQNSDWTQLPDAQLSDLELASWNEYRQALRDIPQQTGFPATCVYPLAPNEEAR